MATATTTHGNAGGIAVAERLAHTVGRVLPIVAMAAAASDDPVFAPLGVIVYVLAALAAGLYLPPPWRGEVVRSAAGGTLAYALVRILSMATTGGIGGVALGDALPPALISLAAFLAAVVTGLWWRAIWRTAPRLVDA